MDTPEVEKHLSEILKGWRTIAALPEHNPAEIEAKKKRYQQFAGGQDSWLLSQIAAIPVAQFYIEKAKENQPKLITDEEYRRYLDGHRTPQGQATSMAWALANRKRFFHWFLEFPEIIEQGGFDCILGNPPYLGGQKLSGNYGHSFCNYVKWEYAPAGLSNLVAYFVRRIYSLLCPSGFTAFITTSSIKDGDVRRDSIEQILSENGELNFVTRSIKWPGPANVDVSLVAIHKGKWNGRRVIDGKEVSFINEYFEDTRDIGEPHKLMDNKDRIFQGVIFLGDGFRLTKNEAMQYIDADERNNDVIFPLITTNDINSHPLQNTDRFIINFFNWSIDKAESYKDPFERVLQLVKPKREGDNRELYRRLWWIYAEGRRKLSENLTKIDRCFVAARSTKYLNFSAYPSNFIFTDVFVFTTNRWEIFSVVQSIIHEVWARKYSGAKGQAG